jgi:hypothetical protein
MVYCTVELKVIGNLECRIKFYREKKPPHFFYTIEYPYPPTNSARRIPAYLMQNNAVGGSKNIPLTAEGIIHRM